MNKTNHDRGKKGGQKYQNTFKYKHNKASKRTAHILALPLGGVCRRCMDILQWRREFRKVCCFAAQILSTQPGSPSSERVVSILT